MTTSRPRITVVGSFAVGLTIRAPRFPVKGETLLGRDFDMGPGGKCSNQAVGAARLGSESHFVGLIGADLFGEMAVKLYAEEGVHTAHLRRTSQRNTASSRFTCASNSALRRFGAYAASTSSSRILSVRSASRVPKINRWFFGKLSTLSSSQFAVSCHFTSRIGSLC